MNNFWITLLVSAGVAVPLIVGVARHFRSRALSRWLTALDIHADREIDEERRRKALKNVQVASSASS